MTEQQVQATAPDAVTSGQPGTSEALAARVNALLLCVAVRKYNADRALESAAAAKQEVVNTLGRGATLTAANPLRPEQEVAQVNVSKATWSASTIDRAATEEWVKARYRDRVVKKTRLLPTVTEQDVLNVLRTFAPYLLEEIDEVPDHVIRQLELKSEKAHRPMGWGGEVGDDAPPGIKVTESDPKVTITFREVQAIDDLILDGVIDMDGNMLGGAL